MRKKRKKTFRYILLIVIALTPLFKLIHLNDYCFGVADLLIISAIAVVFFIAFLVILFYNLYKISLKIELFDFKPLIIFFIFGVSLFFGVKFHDKNIFKTIKMSFINDSDLEKRLELRLFTDKTFEYKETQIEYSCYNKGHYQFLNDTLRLEFLNTSFDKLEKKFILKDSILESAKNLQKIKFKNIKK